MKKVFAKRKMSLKTVVSALTLTFVMVVSFTGCANKEDDSNRRDDREYQDDSNRRDDREYQQDSIYDNDSKEDKYSGYIRSVSTEKYGYDEYGDHLELYYYDFGDKEEVCLPSEIDGKYITVLKMNYNFDNCENVRKITLPDKVEIIETPFHWFLNNLEELVIPDSVKEINHIYSNSPWYKNLNDEFVIVGDGVLIKCNKKSEEIIIPDNVKSIADLGDNVGGTKKIYISNNVQSISMNAFSGIDNLEYISIPKSVKYVYGNIVTSSLLELKDISDNNDKAIIIGDGIFVGWKNIEFDKEDIIHIPDDVKFIASFYSNEEDSEKYYEMLKNDQISEIQIPKNCVVDKKVAEGFMRLFSTIKIGEHYIKKDGTVYSGFNNNYIENKVGMDSKCKKVELDKNVVAIGSEAFANSDVESVSFSENLEYIGAGAFGGCMELRSVTIPGSVKELGVNSFRNCTFLNEVIIENGVEEIPEGFARNSRFCSLLDIYIPESVISIGDGAFEQKIDVRVDEKGFEHDEMGYPESLVIHGKKGSYAEEFANEKDITFEEM